MSGAERALVKGGWGGRTPWKKFTPQEVDRLRLELSWRNGLGFLEDFWNIVYDEKDVAQWRRFWRAWNLRAEGRDQETMATRLNVDQSLVSRTLSGFKWRPNLVQMYLVHSRIQRPREGWKWMLDCTPKPTNPYPRSLQVPERIRSHEDILEFLEQFPTVGEGSEALRFFGLTSEWAEEHAGELFWWLLGFLAGDMGKRYVHNELRVRHYRKSAMNTRMANTDSNFRVLRYVQLALEIIGISSHQVRSESQVIHWNSTSSNIITWMVQVCAGLKEGETTSNHSLVMPWMLTCPKNLIVAFLQGVADSDGYVDTRGFYAEISSVPNISFFSELLTSVGTEPHQYPRDQPRMVRILTQQAIRLPLFNPAINSYRWQQLVRHAIRRKIVSFPLPFGV